MRGIKVWAEAHMDEVLANREEYDARANKPTATGRAGRN